MFLLTESQYRLGSCKRHAIRASLRIGGGHSEQPIVDGIMNERLFSTYQIAKLLGTTLGSVAKWIDQGSLSTCRMPDGTTRITESALINFLTEQGIDLGEVLAKAGYTKVATVGDATGLLPQTIPSEEPDPIDETPITPPPTEEPDPIDETPTTPPPTEEPDPADETASPDLRAGQICDAIFADAAKNNAQTIHLTPHRDHLVLQLRTGGVLRDKLNFDRHLTDDLKREIVECLINLANPDIDPKALTVPCSGQFTRKVDGQDLTLRLSAIPTAGGTKLVIHMPSPPADLELLELQEIPRARLEKLLQGDGLILVASKRRTGRDLTLQTLLNTAKTNGSSTIAIGRNPAANLDNVAQIQIDPTAGLTYSTATAEIEHQDADTILLTELRDPKTALNAFDAAHDGALVIAGTNADSACDAISELLTMGAEPWPLGRTLKAVIEQTSVKTLCEHCKKPGEDSSYEPNGCDRCGQSGWSGGTILTQVVFVEGQLAELIRTGAGPEQIARAIASIPRRNPA